MTYLDEILGGINKQRAALGTGGAEAPADTAIDPAAPVVTSSSAQAATHSLSDEDRLAKALKSLRQNGAGPGHGIKGLKKFGGTVLGYGEHQDADAGRTGKFAVIERGGKLFHLFDDGEKMKIDQGKVARALGIHPKRAALEPVVDPHDIFGAHGAGNGTGGAEAPAGGGTGGLSAQALAAATGGTAGPSPMGGLDGRTGGAEAPAIPAGLEYLLRLARQSGGALAP